MMMKRLVLAALVLFLPACATKTETPKTDTTEQTKRCYLGEDRGTPFGQALRRAATYYGGKATPLEIAMTGLSGLTSLDPRLSVAQGEGKIVLVVPGRPAETVTVGANPEASHLRERATDVVISARKLSPILEQLPHDRIQQAMADALIRRFPTPDKVAIPCPPLPSKPQPLTGTPPLHRQGNCNGLTDMSFGQSKNGAPDTNPVLAIRDTPFIQSGGTLETRRLPLQDPPEIALIQRGVVSYWLGGFINDGLRKWSAVDLDRKRAVFVERRTFDDKVGRARRFADPVLPAGDTRVYARKWATEGRTETELVTIMALSDPQVQAFVCLSDGSWNQPLDQKAMVQPSDTLEARTQLLDMRAQNGNPVPVKKDISGIATLMFMVKAIGTEAPVVEWPFLTGDGAKN